MSELTSFQFALFIAMVGLLSVGWGSALIVFFVKWMKSGGFFAAYSAVDRQFPMYPRYRTMATILDSLSLRQDLLHSEVTSLLKMVEEAQKSSDPSAKLTELRSRLETLEEKTRNPIDDTVVVPFTRSSHKS